MFLSLSLQDHKSVLQCLILKYLAPRMDVLLYISVQKSKSTPQFFSILLGKQEIDAVIC